MIGKIARQFGTIVGVAAATWIVLALLLYGLFYRTINDVYQKVGRDVLQVVCGRMVPNELIYTLTPGECRFTNSEFDIGVRVDADGFRNAREHLGAGPVKVAVIGDSHAMGWGVQQGEKLSSLLARDPRLSVRDLSMSSYGTARELLALQRYGQNADVVILQYCDNDRAENAAFVADPPGFVAKAAERAATYEKEIASLRQSAGQPGPLRGILRSGLGGLAATWRLMLLPPRATRPTPQPVIETEAKLFAGVVAHFKTALAGRTVVVFDGTPRGARVGSAGAFRAALDNEGLDNVVVLDLVGTITPSDYFHIDEHMRARGHAKLAARMLAELDRPGRLPVPR